MDGSEKWMESDPIPGQMTSQGQAWKRRVGGHAAVGLRGLRESDERNHKTAVIARELNGQFVIWASE